MSSWNKQRTLYAPHAAHAKFEVRAARFRVLEKNYQTEVVLRPLNLAF